MRSCDQGPWPSSGIVPTLRLLCALRYPLAPERFSRGRYVVHGRWLVHFHFSFAAFWPRLLPMLRRPRSVVTPRSSALAEQKLFVIFARRSFSLQLLRDGAQSDSTLSSPVRASGECAARRLTAGQK